MSFNGTRSPRWRPRRRRSTQARSWRILSRQFYDTQFDFPKFQADEYADKFLLGVSVRGSTCAPFILFWLAGERCGSHERCASTARARV